MLGNILESKHVFHKRKTCQMLSKTRWLEMEELIRYFPLLQETVLGWTISGRTPDLHQNEPQHTFLVKECSNLEHTLNGFSEVEALEQSTMTAEQQAFEKPLNKMEPNPIGTPFLSKESDYKDPVISREGRKICYCQPHPSFKEKGYTARTTTAFGGGAKPSNGTQQHK